MRLGELTRSLEGAVLDGDPDQEVTGISHDSRRVMPGWMFAALPGRRTHGLTFAEQALAKGAVAVLTDRARPAGVTAPWLTVSEPRICMAEAAWRLAGRPQDGLLLVGITGTNGKSTTAHLVSLILGASGISTAFFGTLGYFLPGNERVPGERTTPEATDLAPLLRRTRELGGSAAAIEVSSHALVERRIAGLEFEVAVWTNLTRDHLDYHGDMESYFQAKRRLFDHHLAADGRRVLPVDDPWASRLLDERRGGDVPWGLDRGTVYTRAVRADLEGTDLELCLPGACRRVRLRLVGMHNVRNAVAAAAAGHAAGADGDAICRGLEDAEPLPGRLERVEVDVPFPVLVDFAHTPDGLRSMLEALRGITDRRLIVVFGAGGDKDRGKRGPMGFAVGELADVAVVTSDNPRSEDPAAIAAAVADGVRAAGGDPLVVLDRVEAIRRALELADRETLLVVAGKGHEATQTIRGAEIPFSDQEVIRELAGRIKCG